MPGQSKQLNPEFATPSLKRKFDPLGQSAHERRYAAESQTKHYYLQKKAVFEQSPEDIRKFS
jgi:hypothetical protein